MYMHDSSVWSSGLVRWLLMDFVRQIVEFVGSNPSRAVKIVVVISCVLWQNGLKPVCYKVFL